MVAVVRVEAMVAMVIEATEEVAKVLDPTVVAVAVLMVEAVMAGAEMESEASGVVSRAEEPKEGWGSYLAKNRRR